MKSRLHSDFETSAERLRHGAVGAERSVRRSCRGLNLIRAGTAEIWTGWCPGMGEECRFSNAPGRRGTGAYACSGTGVMRCSLLRGGRVRCPSGRTGRSERRAGGAMKSGLLTGFWTSPWQRVEGCADC